MALRKKGKHKRWADQKADRRRAKQKKREYLDETIIPAKHKKI